MEKIEVGYREFLPGIHHQYLLYTNSLTETFAKLTEWKAFYNYHRPHGIWEEKLHMNV